MPRRSRFSRIANQHVVCRTSTVQLVDTLQEVAPFGPDICSGVRTDGRLDAGKLNHFVSAGSSFVTS